MKHPKIKTLGAILFAASLITNSLHAQAVETTTTTTTSAGTITEFGGERFLIKTETSPDPLSYSYSKTTTYVDENGVPVSIETVKSGLPVTVYYTKVGDRLVATKVMVRRAVPAPAPTVETVITSVGTITEFGGERFLIKTETSSDPLSYSYSKTTTYVDENGVPVSIETVKSGLPVTVYYTKVGDRLVATKVMVRRAAGALPPIIEKKTTTTTTTRNK